MTLTSLRAATPDVNNTSWTNVSTLRTVGLEVHRPEPDRSSAHFHNDAGNESHAQGTTPSTRLVGARQNQLIDALTELEWPRWFYALEWVDMPLGSVLYESGAVLSHVYFPTTAVVSLQYLTGSGASTEFAVVGNEGLVGVSLFMGGDTTPSRAVVRSAGQGLRLPSNVIKDVFHQPAVLLLLLRYTQALLTQTAQTAVCNRHHSLDQQLCRWLLLSLDRSAGPELTMTQELMSNMLGVRREGVTQSAQRLREAELIEYSRGRIKVLDRAGLEARSCECYAVVKREYDRLLPRCSTVRLFDRAVPAGRSDPGDRRLRAESRQACSR